MTDLTAERVRALLDYNPETGVFIWKERQPEDFNETPARTAEHSCRIWNTQNAGKQAGTTPMGGGYFCLTIGDTRYAAHLIAWLFVHGSWPCNLLDHRDGNPSNNRIGNLRDATTAQNAQSKKRPSTNTSGIKGVSWSAKAGKWVAFIKKDGRATWLGHFDRKEDAGLAYQAAAVVHFGEFARFE